MTDKQMIERAAERAEMHELPKYYLHPAHYDLLEKCGVRMDNFTRAALRARTQAQEG